MKLRVWIPFLGLVTFDLRRETDEERKDRVEKEFREKWGMR